MSVRLCSGSKIYYLSFFFKNTGHEEYDISVKTSATEKNTFFVQNLILITVRLLYL